MATRHSIVQSYPALLSRILRHERKITYSFTYLCQNIAACC